MKDEGREGKIILEHQIRRAIDGDREALEELVRSLQGDVYGLALRMLCNREDAEDATQEILLRIVTRLSQYDFRGKLKTWAYRVAANYILDRKKSAMERLHLSFESFAEELTHRLSLEAFAETEQSLLIEEVKVGCTIGMLQCLDRPHRLVFVLGEILELTGPEAAEILEISPELFRKRLQHARASISTFTAAHCGLVSDTAPCRCNRQVSAALKADKARVDSCDFAEKASSFHEARLIVRQVEGARWALELHRTNHPRTSSIDFARCLLETLDARLDSNLGS